MDLDPTTVVTIVSALAGSTVIQEGIRAARRWRSENVAVKQISQDREREGFERRIADLETRVNALTTQLNETLNRYFTAALEAAKCGAEVQYLKERLAHLLENQNGNPEVEARKPQVHSRSGGGAGPRAQYPASDPAE